MIAKAFPHDSQKISVECLEDVMWNITLIDEKVPNYQLTVTVHVVVLSRLL